MASTDGKILDYNGLVLVFKLILNAIKDTSIDVECLSEDEILQIYNKVNEKED